MSGFAPKQKTMIGQMTRKNKEQKVVIDAQRRLINSQDDLIRALTEQNNRLAEMLGAAHAQLIPPPEERPNIAP